MSHHKNTNDELRDEHRDQEERRQVVRDEALDEADAPAESLDSQDARRDEDGERH